MRISPINHATARGFTLIDVLVAMVVTAVGLLGLAKMQALAVSSTHNAGIRALIALQVGSLVSAMHANKTYWASGSAPATFSATKNTVVDGSGVLSAKVAGGCATRCTAANMAARDVQAWANGMHSLLPTYSAKAHCTKSQPVSCEIYVTWHENQVAMNNTTAAGAPSEMQWFSVFVMP